jgi:cytochrome c
MRRVLAVCIVSGFLFAAGSAIADAELFKKSNCMACHAVDQKRFGPALKDVAAKYDGDASAVDKLSKRSEPAASGCGGKYPCLPNHMSPKPVQ